MSMKPENLLGYICGIDKTYEVMVIGIFIKNNSVQLLGPDGSHQVHSSNNIDMDGYKREAAIVWNLIDMFEIARDLASAPGGLAELRSGMQTALNMRCEFWDHLATEILSNQLANPA